MGEGSPDSGGREGSSSDRSLGARWERLTALGKLLAVVSAFLLVSSLVVAVLAASVRTSGLFIALAALPLVLAAFSMGWPATLLRRGARRAPVEIEGDWRSLCDGQDAAVGELLEWARNQAKAEDERTNGFRAGAGWLLGFAGVIIALAGAQAEKVLDRASALGPVGRPLGTWLLAMAIVLVGVAAFAALQALLPGRSRRVGTRQWGKFLSERYFDRPRAAIRFLEMESLVKQLDVDRQTNEQRLRWLRFGFATLAVALAFMVLHVGVFLERTVESPCAAAARAAAAPSKTVTSPSAMQPRPGNFRVLPVAAGRTPLSEEQPSYGEDIEEEECRK
jgi:hypothetical protein